MKDYEDDEMGQVMSGPYVKDLQRKRYKEVVLKKEDGCRQEEQIIDRERLIKKIVEGTGRVK